MSRCLQSWTFADDAKNSALAESAVCCHLGFVGTSFFVWLCSRSMMSSQVHLSISDGVCRRGFARVGKRVFICVCGCVCLSSQKTWLRWSAPLYMPTFASGLVHLAPVPRWSKYTQTRTHRHTRRGRGTWRRHYWSATLTTDMYRL